MTIKLCVLGAGSWGTALAVHLRRTGASVVLWGRDKAVLKSITSERINPRYFPHDRFDVDLETTDLLGDAVHGAELVVLSLPSAVLRGVVKEVRSQLRKEAIIVSTTKGLEEKTSQTMLAALAQELGNGARLACLSGPSFAKEVLHRAPTAVTVAASSLEIAERAAKYFHHDYFRVYTSTDVLGVELGGVLKNVIAIAAGVVDGLRIGTNARAALITRGLTEMQRLIVALGGDARTVIGLSGLGDLLLTATGELSRNRQVGIRLGRGEKLPEIVSSLGQVAEGVRAAKWVVELAKRQNVTVPIATEVERLLSGEITAEAAVSTLLSRAPKSE